VGVFRRSVSIRETALGCYNSKRQYITLEVLHFRRGVDGSFFFGCYNLLFTTVTYLGILYITVT
jgi:hypothetical protein